MVNRSLQSLYNDIRAGFGTDLCNLIDSSGWSDIMINPNGKVFIDTDVIRETKCKISENGLYSAALMLASYSNQAFNDGNHQSLNVVIPIMNLRANFMAPPAVDHISVTLRKPNPFVVPLEKMIETGTFTATQVDYLNKAVDEYKNIIFSGGTSSGKTTALNSLVQRIDNEDRIVMIEDVREIRFSQPDVLSVLVNRDYTYVDAIGDSLRQRPTRIIVGECRFGKQALEMLKAWNTGHPGGFSTIHANNAKDVFRRLDQLCSEESVSSQQDMIHDAVDVVVQMTRLKKSRARQCTELLDVKTGEYIR